MRPEASPDLSTQHRAAEGFGLLIAQGIISQSEALASLIAAARRAGSNRAERDLENEFIWCLAAAVADWSTWRDMALRHVQRAVETVPYLTIKQAVAINAEYGNPLLGGELRACITPEGEPA